MRVVQKTVIFDRYDGSEKVRMYLDDDGDPVFEHGDRTFYIDRGEFIKAMKELGIV